MNIAFIWQVTYPWDVRLEKIMRACTEAGHEVSLLCRNKSSLPDSEVLQGVKIKRVEAPRPFSGTALGRRLTFPLFMNPLWISAISQFFEKEKFDLAIVRDLPLAYLAARYGNKSGVPVILDMAENYPAALKAYQNPLYRPFLVGDSWLPKQYERISVQLMSHVFVVANASAERLLSLGVPPSRLTVVGNTPERKFYASLAEPPNQTASGTNNYDKLSLLYVGKIDAHRGVEVVIRAMPMLLQEFPNLSFVIAGTGTEVPKLKTLSEQLGVSKAVIFSGWVEHAKTAEYIAGSTVCLIPHLRSDHSDSTLPNKLFDYMAFGKPVVASNCKPIEQIINETKCGQVFRSGDAEDLGKALTRLLSDPLARLVAGRNGWRAIQEQYNWDVDRAVFLKTIENVRNTKELELRKSLR